MPRTEPLNHVVLRGDVASTPETRELASGSFVVQFDLSVRDPAGRRVTVPVSWDEPPPARAAEITAEVELVVVGWVRRRFFRVAGSTQSRTEVVATDVVPARRARTAAVAVGRVVDALTDS